MAESRARTAARLAQIFGLEEEASSDEVPAVAGDDVPAVADLVPVMDADVIARPATRFVPDAGPQAEALQAMPPVVAPGGDGVAEPVVAAPGRMVGVMAPPDDAGTEPMPAARRSESAATSTAPDKPAVDARARAPRHPPATRPRSSSEAGKPARLPAGTPRPVGAAGRLPVGDGSTPTRRKPATPRRSAGKRGSSVGPASGEAMVGAACPTCAAQLSSVPVLTRRCVQCRQRIVVRRVEGRTVLLAEAVIPMFEAERRRMADASRLAKECGRWLRLAAHAGAPDAQLDARARLALARPSEERVASARAFYLATVERAFRAARRDKRWEDAARLRRDQAIALHRAAGSPVPLPADVLALHREATAASLRGIAELAREAELVAATCCDACRADANLVVRVTAELRAPRLPHASCPRGICACRWDLPTRHRAAVRRLARRSASAS